MGGGRLIRPCGSDHLEHGDPNGLSPAFGLRVPYLGVIGTVKEEMGWGTTPEEAFPILPDGAEFHALADTGHFVHIERLAISLLSLPISCDVSW